MLNIGMLCVYAKFHGNPGDSKQRIKMEGVDG